ncbi:hypothetical protein CRD15_09875 [Corynebacterium sp. LK28]|nr:hypothetical protein [Corynebacterium sp. LK28]
MVDYISSQPDWAGYQVSTFRGSGPVFFSFDATKAYGTGAEDSVADNQIIHLDEDTEALYGFTWNLETDQHEAGGDQP